VSPVLSNRAGLKLLRRQVVSLAPLPETGEVVYETPRNTAYATKGDEVSWFEDEPKQPLRLLLCDQVASPLLAASALMGLPNAVGSK
jgi:hypothetical protein